MILISARGLLATTTSAGITITTSAGISGVVCYTVGGIGVILEHVCEVALPERAKPDLPEAIIGVFLEHCSFNPRIPRKHVQSMPLQGY